MITCVSLNPAYDVCLPVKELKRGGVLRSHPVYSCPGGKPLNTARALSSLGAAVSASGFCPEKEIKTISSFCSLRGIRPFFTPVPGNSRTCFIITESARNRETVINTEGTIKPGTGDKMKFLNKLQALAKKSSFAVLSGSLPLSLPESYYRTITAKLKPLTKILIDCHSGPALLAARAKPDILKMNLDEFALTFGLKNKNKSALKNKIRFVSNGFSINSIIITMHSKGAVFYFLQQVTFTALQ